MRIERVASGVQTVADTVAIACCRNLRKQILDEGAWLQAGGFENIELLHLTINRVLKDALSRRCRGDGQRPGRLPVEAVRLVNAVIEQLVRTGVKIEQLDESTIKASRASAGLKSADVITEPHPLFPTDMQAQYMALMTQAEGTSVITETIFENRFMHASELVRLGADITISGNHATVRGASKLTGARIIASDLRASASLVLAGLAAGGETTIDRVYHIDRGYETIVRKFRSLGADIERVSDQLSEETV